MATVAQVVAAREGVVATVVGTLAVVERVAAVTAEEAKGVGSPFRWVVEEMAVAVTVVAVRVVEVKGLAAWAAVQREAATVARTAAERAVAVWAVTKAEQMVRAALM
eukprot:2818419-Prymnesium_polylepis.1